MKASFWAYWAGATLVVVGCARLGVFCGAFGLGVVLMITAAIQERRAP